LFDAGDDVGMVLSPQCFHNIDAHADIFNHGNVQFWEYAQVGYDAIGFISCTGARPAACFRIRFWLAAHTLSGRAPAARAGCGAAAMHRPGAPWRGSRAR